MKVQSGIKLRVGLEFEYVHVLMYSSAFIKHRFNTRMCTSYSKLPQMLCLFVQKRMNRLNLSVYISVGVFCLNSMKLNQTYSNIYLKLILESKHHVKKIAMLCASEKMYTAAMLCINCVITVSEDCNLLTINFNIQLRFLRQPSVSHIDSLNIFE